MTPVPFRSAFSKMEQAFWVENLYFNRLDIVETRHFGNYIPLYTKIFKYIVHQNAVETAHKEVYAAQSLSKKPFADFNKWRNEILDISIQL